MKRGYYKGQELTMSELGLSLEELVGQPLELFAREGVKLLLTVALEEEVAAYLMRRPYERSQGKIRGYRNGHRERQVSARKAFFLKLNGPEYPAFPASTYS